MAEQVVAAVGAQHVPDVDAVVDALRRGVEDLVQRAVGIELTWFTNVGLRSDDLVGCRVVDRGAVPS